MPLRFQTYVIKGVGVQALKDGRILSPDLNPKGDPGKTAERVRKGETGMTRKLSAI